MRTIEQALAEVEKRGYHVDSAYHLPFDYKRWRVMATNMQQGPIRLNILTADGATLLEALEGVLAKEPERRLIERVKVKAPVSQFDDMLG